jgi:hypothetical protein
MKRVIYNVAGMIIVAIFVLIVSDVTLLPAQPALPTPPPRPISWGSVSLIGACCVGYAWWRLRRQ